ncbi:alpha/beta hydrolase [Nannocystis sp.]|uniref:alpha/beta fold hydrolase n=1 Tax=Nannocystis sp. TaxID=1962667 RepID=UPI002422ED83|nr:alpha/beta hydrolase [Nannocystis sp.]MBK7826639.1 alpha/beta fold hydrolase [Nannocystis sp.]MBK9754259.1 alpha/beta fold hydrolase [Nannocystis sp.]
MRDPGFSLSLRDASRLVELSFGRVFLRDHGPAAPAAPGGPPVLLLHGLLVTSHSFTRLIPELASDHRVLAPDLPGCGDSDRPPPVLCADYSPRWLAAALQELLDRLGLAQVDLVGHSWGGAIAVCLADAAPARVRRLVLVDPTLFAMPVPIEGRLATVPRIGPYMFHNMYRRNELRRYLGRAFSSERLVDEADVDIYWDRLARSGGREAAHAMLMQLLGADTMAGMLPRMRALTAPTLVVWGDRDGIVPREHADRVAAAIPGATLRWLEGCGHTPPEEQPEALAALLRQHLDGAGVGASAHP